MDQTIASLFAQKKGQEEEEEEQEEVSFFYPLEALWFLPAKCGMESFRSFETNSLWVLQPQKD